MDRTDKHLSKIYFKCDFTQTVGPLDYWNMINNSNHPHPFYIFIYIFFCTPAKTISKHSFILCVRQHSFRVQLLFIKSAKYFPATFRTLHVIDFKRERQTGWGACVILYCGETADWGGVRMTPSSFYSCGTSVNMRRPCMALISSLRACWRTNLRLEFTPNNMKQNLVMN